MRHIDADSSLFSTQCQDLIFISALEVNTIIGVYDWEKKTEQPLSFDIEMNCDIRRVALTDKIDQALDYSRVCDRIIEFVRDNRYELLETLAENVAKMILKEFTVSKIYLKLSKPKAVPSAKTVGVAITRYADVESLKV